MNLECSDRIRLVGDDGKARVTICANTAEVEIDPALLVSDAAMDFWNTLRAVGADDVIERVETADAFDRIKLALDLDPLHTIDDVVEEIDRLRTSAAPRATRRDDLAELRKTDGISRSVLIERINQLCETMVAIAAEDTTELSERERDLVSERNAMFENLTEVQRRSNELILASRAAAVPRDERQRRVAAWVRETFGDVSMTRKERLLRFIEEAIELAQAGDLTQAEIRSVLVHVFSKGTGEIAQEVGGVAVTLLAFCAVAGVSADLEEVSEIGRVMAIDPAHFRARHNAKADAGIAVRVDADPAVTGPGAIAILPRERGIAIGGAAEPLNGASAAFVVGDPVRLGSAK